MQMNYVFRGVLQAYRRRRSARRTQRLLTIYSYNNKQCDRERSEATAIAFTCSRYN